MTTYAILEANNRQLRDERDFLADQVDKLESVIDSKQDTVDELQDKYDKLVNVYWALVDVDKVRKAVADDLRAENTQLKKDQDFLLGMLTYITTEGQ